jgi:NAD(P)-dependent dehydrogenase (short-subunit alcohol dehydrogenase family)
MLENKVALVTGAGSGIGRAVATAYGREGASVVVSDMNVDAGNETVALLRENNVNAQFVKADVTSPEECVAMVDAAVSHFGRLDIACNNAGANTTPTPTADTELENWRKVIDVNLSGVFYCLRAQIPAMLANNAPESGGAIVNIASILGSVGHQGVPAYVASKHGVVGLTQTASLDYAAQGIRVNAVGPGFIETPFIAHRLNDEQLRNELVSRHPIGRLGRAEDVAELVLWLSSPRASFVTGSYYPVDGGYLSR